MARRKRSRIPHVLWTSLPLRCEQLSWLDWAYYTAYIPHTQVEDVYVLCADSLLVHNFDLTDAQTIWLELLDQPTPDTYPVTLQPFPDELAVRVTMRGETQTLDDNILNWEARQLIARHRTKKFHLRVWRSAD